MNVLLSMIVALTIVWKLRNVLSRFIMALLILRFCITNTTEDYLRQEIRVLMYLVVNMFIFLIVMIGFPTTVLKN